MTSCKDWDCPDMTDEYPVCKSSDPTNITDVQKERGKNYGKFSDHSECVDNIMAELKKINSKKNGSLNYPRGFETVLFYMVSKMVRLATTPGHEDSALDLSSYANLWLKIIKEEK